MRSVAEIWSGGQTGVDRAALDAALEAGVPIGGWIPLGRTAEDGTVPSQYRGLVETDSESYSVRTERNVRETDATLIVGFGALFGGTALTHQIAVEHGRPVLVLDLKTTELPDAVAVARQWCDGLPPSFRLNVAGPRASEVPGIYRLAHSLLTRLLQPASES